jgi:tetratricopeptide (TPR) repeat protein
MQIRNPFSHTLSVLIPTCVLLVIVGCSGNLITKGRKHLDRGEYKQAQDLFYQSIAENPTNLSAWRELGIAFYREGEFQKAEVALDNAPKGDPLTLLYMGLVHESMEKRDQAVDDYLGALELHPRGKLAARIQKRMSGLLRQQIEERVAAISADEEEIGAADTPDNTIAVLDIDGSQLTEDIAPVARGIAALVASDLAKVQELKSVERLKLEAIMNELRLTQSGLVNTLSAPKMGRLLGAHNVVTGAMMGVQDKLMLGGSLVDSKDGLEKQTEPSEGKLQDIFRVEKKFVFTIVDSLGIRLSVEERDAIQEVPTESYLAFLAYSRGLEYREQGYLRAAQLEFEKAGELDSDFDQAQEELDITETLITADQLGDVSMDDLDVIAQQELVDLGIDVTGDIGESLTDVVTDAGITPGDLETAGQTTTGEEPPVSPDVGTASIKGNLDGN